MTHTIHPAQLEAVARAIYLNRGGYPQEWWAVPDTFKESLYPLAKAAIIAAFKPLPIEDAPTIETVDLFVGTKRYPRSFYARPTYGKCENGGLSCWCYESGYDCDGPVDEEVINPTGWLPIPQETGK